MITLRTNLDYITTPTYNSSILPPIGARVVCNVWHSEEGSKNVSLEVCGHTFVGGRWEVELHIPKNFSGSIREWYKTYCGIDI